MKKLFKLNIQLFAESGATGGEGGTGANGQSTSTTELQGTAIDYAKIEEIVNKRSNQTSNNVLVGYLKQQGLSGAELEQAVANFKQQKSAAEQAKVQEQENMKLENQRLKAQILNSSIDSTLTTLAAAEGVSADKIPFLAKLIERNGLADDKGNVLQDKVKEAMMSVLKAFPDFKSAAQQNNGFQQIGSGGNQQSSNALDDKLDAIFGVKKK